MKWSLLHNVIVERPSLARHRSSHKEFASEKHHRGARGPRTSIVMVMVMFFLCGRIGQNTYHNVRSHAQLFLRKSSYVTTPLTRRASPRVQSNVYVKVSRRVPPAARILLKNNSSNKINVRLHVFKAIHQPQRQTTCATPRESAKTNAARAAPSRASVSPSLLPPRASSALEDPARNVQLLELTHRLRKIIRDRSN